MLSWWLSILPYATVGIHTNGRPVGSETVETDRVDHRNRRCVSESKSLAMRIKTQPSLIRWHDRRAYAS